MGNDDLAYLIRRIILLGRNAVHSPGRYLRIATNLVTYGLAAPRRTVRRIIPGHTRLTGQGRLCVLSHWDRHGRIDDHVLHLLDHLQAAGCETILVSTCRQLEPRSLARARRVTALIVHRRNVGRDFGSWRVGLDLAGDLAGYQQVILANDSIYGPLFRLDEVLERMSRDYDIWGITDSWERAYHLQSYFLVFNARVAHSPFFQRFWRRYRFVSDKEFTINHYEVGLTRKAIKAGWTVGALFEYPRLAATAVGCRDGDPQTRRFLRSAATQPVNPSHFYWRSLIEQHRCPFLKVELVRDNPSHVPDVWRWPEVIERCTDYDSALITEHMKRAVGAR